MPMFIKFRVGSIYGTINTLYGTCIFSYKHLRVYLQQLSIEIICPSKTCILTKQQQACLVLLVSKPLYLLQVQYVSFIVFPVSERPIYLATTYILVHKHRARQLDLVSKLISLRTCVRLSNSTETVAQIANPRFLGPVLIWVCQL